MTLPDGATLYTLERPWLNNAVNVSCIPAGIYEARWLERSGSGKYKRVWHVADVPGRSGILIHAGNLVRHTLGCILPGITRRWGPELFVGGSRSALGRMRDQLEGEDFVLVIY